MFLNFALLLLYSDFNEDYYFTGKNDDYIYSPVKNLCFYMLVFVFLYRFKVGDEGIYWL